MTLSERQGQPSPKRRHVATVIAFVATFGSLAVLLGWRVWVQLHDRVFAMHSRIPVPAQHYYYFGPDSATFWIAAALQAVLSLGFGYLAAMAVTGLRKNRRPRR